MRFIRSFLDVSNGAGMTPLMMAVTTGNAWMSSFLMGKKVRTDHTDNNLNTVYHHAAVTSKEIIEVNSSLTEFLVPFKYNLF